ncbi:aromatic amino acid transport family protein [uncultured Megasphaera sp.]|uniref:aromatic amino acid transport family protein n=1 Tax=uncultured Megasphaera sp. TaxID=165188 RepID=UPI00259216AF|nr:aromatic amino acid transport family protein [uncultured Megasphaera sp.]
MSIGNSVLRSLFRGESYERASGLSKEEWKKVTAFSGIDVGWIIMCIGMSLGAGIIFLPIQVGLSGLLIFLLVALVGYPIAYQHQKLYLDVLAEAPECEDFAGIISGYLGKNWGFFLGSLYFIFTTILIFLYSTALTNDSSSFLVTFGVTDHLLSENLFYGLFIITFLVMVASQGEKLLMKISSGMVFTKAAVIALLGIIMFPHWHIANVLIPENITYVIKHFIIMLPFIAMSIEFFVGLGPVVIYFRSQSENKMVAHYRSMRVYNLAYLILVILVVFYTISFNLAINHEQAVHAYTANISALALAARDMSGSGIKILNLILNIFAVVTAYFAMFLSFRDACTGIVMNVLKRITSEENLNRRVLKYGISVFCVLLCWGIILVNVPILKFTPILGCLIGIIACFLPACLVWKLDYLKKYKDWKLIPVIFMGLILLISPIISLW